MPPKIAQNRASAQPKANLSKPAAAPALSANRKSTGSYNAIPASAVPAAVPPVAPAVAPPPVAPAALARTASGEGKGLKRSSSNENMGMPRRAASSNSQTNLLARSVSRMAPITEDKKKTVSTKKNWIHLKLDLEDLKKKWEILDPINEGLTPHSFKGFCRDNSIDFTVMTLNVLMSDGRGSFGELLSSLIVDPTDPVVRGLEWEALYEEFFKLDENKDGVVDGEEFDRFTAQCNVAQKQIDEGMPAVTFTDFVEWKITGKLKNVKGLDGLKRKFDDFVKINKGKSQSQSVPYSEAELCSPAREPPPVSVRYEDLNAATERGNGTVRGDDNHYDTNHGNENNNDNNNVDNDDGTQYRDDYAGTGRDGGGDDTIDDN